MNEGTLELAALGLSKILEPLGEVLKPARVSSLMASMGVRFPDAVLQQSAIAGLVSATQTAAAGLPALRAALEGSIAGGNTLSIISAGGALMARAASVLSSGGAMARALGALPVASVPGLDAGTLADFSTNFTRRLLAQALIGYMQTRVPTFSSVLALGGVLDNLPVEPAPANPARTAHMRRDLHLDRLADFLTNPAALLRTLFGWGNPAPDYEALLGRLAASLGSLGLVGRVVQPAPGQFELHSLFADISPDTTTAPPGLSIQVHASVENGTTRSFPLGPFWTTNVTVQGSFASGLELKIAPPARLALTSGPPSFNGRLAATLERHGPPLVLLGAAGGTRLEVGACVIGAGIAFTSQGAAAVAEPRLELRLENGRAVIDTSKGDSFLSFLTGGGAPETPFSFTGSWSPSEGLRIDGNAALELAISTHATAGPITLSTLYLRLGIEGGAFPIEISAALAGKLGPLSVAVDRIGILARASFPAQGGNAGPLDFSLGFQAPKGVGLSLEAGVITGGGYLFIDAARGEYAGALELTFSGFLSLKAIGIITTKMPDGSNGFSLLIIITAEFATGIQLGFGFTLLAVGGLIGLNRTIRMDALGEGVRTGAVNSIMFPKDVIANAPRIISDLRLIFPPQEGKFLIGPMAKLGWGTPTLISLSLGVIIEIPGNIAILGVLKMALPADDVAILILQVAFVGALEFDKKRVWFFAVLFESRVLFATIEGGLGVLAAFGDDANFVVTVGGFHPRFNPPPLPFPAPPRLSIDLLNSPVARIRVEGYFALTPNTAQFGARAELFYGLDEVNVQGHIGFDALLQFSPFHFIVEISASFSANVFGFGLFSVDLQLALEGIAPWRARGSGSISFLFFDVSADFDITWGESRDTALPPIQVLPIFQGEFRKVENWRALFPPANRQYVSLRKLPPEEAALVLHPLGVLRVSQKALPLELKLDKVGNQKPSDVNRLAVRVKTGGLVKTGDVQEKFALAQFQEMDNAQKLSQPAYGDQHGGIDISAEGRPTRSRRMVKRVARYEQIVLDTAFRRIVFRFLGIPIAFFNFLTGGSSVCLSAVSETQKRKVQPFTDKILVREETYSVVLQATNRAHSAVSVAFPSAASARDYLQQQVTADPNLADALHVVPDYERAA